MEMEGKAICWAMDRLVSWGGRYVDYEVCTDLLGELPKEAKLAELRRPPPSWMTPVEVREYLGIVAQEAEEKEQRLVDELRGMVEESSDIYLVKNKDGECWYGRGIGFSEGVHEILSLPNQSAMEKVIEAHNGPKRFTFPHFSTIAERLG